MVTDTERRDVARRLRSVNMDDFSCYPEEFEGLYKAIGLYDGEEYSEQDWPERLADLIEPSASATPTHLRRHTDASATVRVSQRGALLELADEMLANADESRELHDEMLKEKRLDMALIFHEYACELREYAERIHEALGASDG